MIVYNVTVKVDLDISREWVQWMKQVHIPEVMATGFFVDYRMLRMMEQNEMDGITFAIQYRAESMAKIRTYQEEHAPKLQKEHGDRYDGKFVAFRSFLREL